MTDADLRCGMHPWLTVLRGLIGGVGLLLAYRLIR